MVDVALVQAVAGHARAATTLRSYTHLRDRGVKKAALRFDPGTPTGHRGSGASPSEKGKGPLAGTC
jgi:hypothetical protein